MRLTAEQMHSLPSFFSQPPRSPPGPRATPSFRHGVGDRRRREPVWHARIQGHRGLGAKPLAEGAGAFRLPSRKGPSMWCPASLSSAMC